MNFDDAFTRLLGNEGAYSNDPADSGGETMWGVTKRVAQANGYTGAMADMTQDQAKAIYKPLYWDAVFGDLLGDLAFHVFDASVNSGPVQAIRWLQQSLGVSDDGVIGPATKLAIAQSDKSRLALIYNGNRLDFMTGLAAWPNFGKGWARRIANNLRI